MCPTFLATGEEFMSTRGRANLIRASLEQRGMSGADPLFSDEVELAISNCLSCKACTSECPSNVNMALIKAEILHARIVRRGLSLRERVLSSVDLLGKAGCIFPRLSNWLLDSLLMRTLFSKFLGMAWQRPLPHYTGQRFDSWFWKRSAAAEFPRGKVILWDDTFVRYHEPHIGQAAVRVLEAAGFQVTILGGRKCCGRPAFSQGNLEMAARLGQHNLDLLNAETSGAPIIFLEPSCYSMFVEDYFELRLNGAHEVARRAVLFERFMEDFLQANPNAMVFDATPGNIVIHAHCHARSLMKPNFMKRLAQRLPARRVTLLDTGCCGMAGAFGALASKYELSLKIAEPLAQQLRSQPFGTVVVASGTSCRHQIEHLAPVRPRHMAEVLADAIY